jgi:hypothetical protein
MRAEPEADVSTPTRTEASVVPARSEGGVVGWVLSVYPEAGEAGGSFRYARQPRRIPTGISDPERSAAEAARRARGKLRRYCAANRLNRLGTLTYRGEGCHDPVELRSHLGGFFRQMRRLTGGKAFPYVWVPEWHHTDHGLHAHFAVGRFIKRSVIEQAWGRGFVHIKLLGDLPHGAGSLEEARRAAVYLSKYVAKAIDDRRIPRHHRYDVAQSFQPVKHSVWGRTVEEAIEAASVGFMGGRWPSYRWSSEQQADWKAPPSVWVSWAA